MDHMEASLLKLIKGDTSEAAKLAVRLIKDDCDFGAKLSLPIKLAKHIEEHEEQARKWVPQLLTFDSNERPELVVAALEAMKNVAETSYLLGQTEFVNQLLSTSRQRIEELTLAEDEEVRAAACASLGYWLPSQWPDKIIIACFSDQEEPVRLSAFSAALHLNDIAGRENLEMTKMLKEMKLMPSSEMILAALSSKKLSDFKTWLQSQQKEGKIVKKKEKKPKPKPEIHHNEFDRCTTLEEDKPILGKPIFNDSVHSDDQQMAKDLAVSLKKCSEESDESSAYFPVATPGSKERSVINQLLASFSIPNNTNIRIVKRDKTSSVFWDDDDYDEDDPITDYYSKVEISAYQKATALMKENLTHLIEARIGWDQVCFPVLYVGKSSAGNWVGVAAVRVDT